MVRRLAIVAVLAAALLIVGVGPTDASPAAPHAPRAVSVGETYCSLGGGLQFQFADHDAATTTTVRIGSKHALAFTPLPRPAQTFTTAAGSGAFPGALGEPPVDSYWTVQFEFIAGGVPTTVTSGLFDEQTCVDIPIYTDVAHDDPFASAIGFLTDVGILNGYPDSTFRPTRAMTRQAMAALIYWMRRSGAPPPAPCSDAPFVDVPVDHPFCPYIEWLVEQDIASGFPDGTFRPAAPVTRQSGAAFFYRLYEDGFYFCRGTIPPQADAGFADVDATHPFHQQIWWTSNSGIANGYPDGSFRPTTSLTRQAASSLALGLIAICAL